MSAKTKQVATESATALVTSLLDAIEQSDGTNWTKPWSETMLAGMPVNASTGKSYQGSNVWVLTMVAMMRDYEGPQWATYKQWQSLGAQVQRGESGTKGLYAGTKRVDDRDSNDPDATKIIWITRSFTLFHRAQTDADEKGVEGKGQPTTDETLTDLDRDNEMFALVDELVAANGVTVMPGNRACYTPSTDTVTLPPVDTFTSVRGYFATAVHELAHWTGHPSRNDRHDKPSKFGSPEYAREELTVEMAALLVAANQGIALDGDEDADEHREQSVEYLANWLRAWQRSNAPDPSVIFDLLSDAEAAANYLLDAVEEQVEEAA